MALEKYHELFVYSNNLLQNEHERFNRIDEKAGSYLSVITLLLGIEGAFGKDILRGLIPPSTFLEYILLNVAVLSFFMLVATWFVIFRTLRIHALKGPRLNQEMVDFFNNQTEVNIYYALAKANADAWKQNVLITDRKSEAMRCGYRMIIGTVSIFVLFICLYFLQMWNKVPSSGEKRMGQIIETNNPAKTVPTPVPESPTAPQPAQEPHPRAEVHPDMNVKAPDFTLFANEGDEGKE